MKNKVLKTIALGLCFTAAFTFASCNKDKEEQAVKVEGTTYYVNYNGTGDGKTKENPIGFEAISAKAEPGDTLLLAGGTYEYAYRIELRNSGVTGGYITVKPQSENDRVIFDFHQQSFNSSNRGIQIYGNYWHFYKVEICGAGDK